MHIAAKKIIKGRLFYFFYELILLDFLNAIYKDTIFIQYLNIPKINKNNYQFIFLNVEEHSVIKIWTIITATQMSNYETNKIAHFKFYLRKALKFLTYFDANPDSMGFHNVLVHASASIR